MHWYWFDYTDRHFDLLSVYRLQNEYTANNVQSSVPEMTCYVLKIWLVEIEKVPSFLEYKMQIHHSVAAVSQLHPSHAASKSISRCNGMKKLGQKYFANSWEKKYLLKDLIYHLSFGMLSFLVRTPTNTKFAQVRHSVFGRLLLFELCVVHLELLYVW